MWFIVKISFVKKNNCPDNLNYHNTIIGFLGRILGLLIKNALPLIGNVTKPLAKHVLIALGLTAAVSARDEAIGKKMFGSGTTTLVIANKERNDIMKRTSLFKNLIYQ